MALSDVNEEALAETVASLAGGTNVTSHRVDVGNRAAVEGYAADVKARHGGADVIINAFVPFPAEQFNRVARTTPEDAARVVLDAVEKNEERVFVAIDAKLMAAAKRATPASTISLSGWATRWMWARAS